MIHELQKENDNSKEKNIINNKINTIDIFLYLITFTPELLDQNNQFACPLSIIKNVSRYKLKLSSFLILMGGMFFSCYGIDGILAKSLFWKQSGNSVWETLALLRTVNEMMFHCRWTHLRCGL